MFVTCCAWMTNAMARVGSDAIAVVVSLKEGEPLFFLQGRPFTHSRSTELESRLKDPEFRRALEPMFRDLLELTDPLRQAFERTTRLGEDYSFIRLPPITEADIAAAKEVERRIASGLPAILPRS